MKPERHSRRSRAGRRRTRGAAADGRRSSARRIGETNQTRSAAPAAV